MPAVKKWVLLCEEEDCGAKFSPVSENISLKTLELFAESYDWVVIDDQCWCPDHAPE